MKLRRAVAALGLLVTVAAQGSGVAHSGHHCEFSVGWPHKTGPRLPDGSKPLIDVGGKSYYDCTGISNRPDQVGVHQVLYYCPGQLPDGDENTWATQGECAIVAEDHLIADPAATEYVTNVFWRNAQTGWYAHCVVYHQVHGDAYYYEQEVSPWRWLEFPPPPPPPAPCPVGPCQTELLASRRSSH